MTVLTAPPVLTVERELTVGSDPTRSAGPAADPAAGPEPVAPDEELFDQLPGRPVHGPDGGAAGPVIAGWWAERARGMTGRLAGSRTALVARLPRFTERMPARASGFFSRRSRRLVAQAAVLAVVLVGIVGYVTLDKSVTLTVDGRSRQVHSFAGSVGSLLKAEKVKVNDRDVVAPATSAGLHDGDEIVVRYARQLQLVIDGKPGSYWTTELTVDAALRALGIRSDGARLSASRSQPIGRDGLALTLSMPKTVTVVADGRSRSVTSTAGTVADLLGDQGVTVRPLDRLSVLATTAVTDGLVVSLTRIDHRRVSATEKVAFATTKRSSATLFKGQTKVVTPGRAGSRKAVYDLVLTNGKVTSKTLVAATVTTAPVSQVVELGTKSKPAAPTAPTGGGGTVGGSTGSLNWAALARCESGGNPRAVNPAGYYGLYQFSLSTWRAMGGSGNPINSSSAEQTHRAQILYQRAGAGQWPVCGRKLFT